MSVTNQKTTRFSTSGGVSVAVAAEELSLDSPMAGIIEAIDTRRGAIFASGYEYPGRYSRWDVGFVDPPVELVSYQRRFVLRSLNDRGEVLLGIFHSQLAGHADLADLQLTPQELSGTVNPMPDYFPEEERSKQPTIFSVLRTLVGQMYHADEGHLGFYGAMGYDLVFQFEPMELRHDRPTDRPDLHLFLPDELVVVDHQKEQARRFCYDFEFDGTSTQGLERRTSPVPRPSGVALELTLDHATGEYAEKVRKIIAGTERGDFFEVVLSQVLSAGFGGTPIELFKNIRQRNPSPYEFLINLGEEQLVGASPEMFVRVEGERVETCPISGTIPRGRTPMEDAEKILELLNSEKDEAELTMCTDVDRNDKARVCVAGTVEVIGRRMIESYSRLLHTVDHVVGTLRSGCDGFDALLSHMWACTLTGAPKPAAMQTVENLENSAREWYGGCVGMFLFNKDVNTGITIRTVHLKEGMAHVRAGATLLCDSDADEEERETRTKAEAFINAVLGRATPDVRKGSGIPLTGVGKRVLFVDNKDSFVHTLGDYVRQTGAEIVTVRAGFPERVFDDVNPDLVFISPGPGTPADFGVPDLVRQCVARGLPVFGVCLGMQGLIEAFGGKLGILPYPMHGKSSLIRCTPEGILAEFPAEFVAGRYHSLCGDPEHVPSCLRVLARSEDDVIMAVQHEDYPAAAVQFHPESILTLKDDLGLRLIAEVIGQLTAAKS